MAAAAGKQQGGGKAPDLAILSSAATEKPEPTPATAELRFRFTTTPSEADAVDLAAGDRSQRGGGDFSRRRAAGGGRIEASGGQIGGEAGAARGWNAFQLDSWCARMRIEKERIGQGRAALSAPYLGQGGAKFRAAL